MSQFNFSGRKAAFIVANGFCEREFQQSFSALQKAGISCRIISVDNNLIKGWNEEKKAPKASDWGNSFAADSVLGQVQPSEFDMVVIPGGRRSVEKLELCSDVKSFISYFMDTGLPVVAYNKAVELLVHFDLIERYSVAAIGNLCETVKTVGARCAAPEFVVSKNLITLTRYRDVDEKLIHAVNCIFNGEKYMVESVSSGNLPSAHKAA